MEYYSVRLTNNTILVPLKSTPEISFALPAILGNMSVQVLSQEQAFPTTSFAQIPADGILHVSTQNTQQAGCDMWEVFPNAWYGIEFKYGQSKIPNADINNKVALYGDKEWEVAGKTKGPLVLAVFRPMPERKDFAHLPPHIILNRELLLHLYTPSFPVQVGTIFKLFVLL